MKIESVNRGFKRTSVWILRHRWLVLAAFAVLMALSVVGTKRIVMKTSFDDYFLEDDPVLVKTNEFKSIFGNDYYAAVLVKSKDIFSHRSLSLIRELSNELLDSLSYAEKITSLTDLEFTVGTDEGMTIEQIVPDEIPTDAASLAAIRKKAFSKPYLARKVGIERRHDDMDSGEATNVSARAGVEKDEPYIARHTYGKRTGAHH